MVHEAPQQFCELWVPAAAAGPAPVAVFVHGGYWKSEWGCDLSLAMADDMVGHGWASWNVEYRRVGYKENGYEPQPGGGWPGTFLDVAAGLDMLADAAAEHPGRLVRAHGAPPPAPARWC